MVLALIDRDCAKKIRIHYQLPNAVTEELLEIFPDAEVKVNRFSQFVQSARDHFALTAQLAVYITGVIGENNLYVTFWKDNIDDGLAYFEHSLSTVYSEPIDYHMKPRSMEKKYS